MKPRALLVIAVLLAEIGCEETREFRADLDKVNADTGDVMASATYQRFALRRAAVAAMKVDLRSLAAAESAFVADSGRATVNPPRSYWSAKGRGNYATIRVERDRWVANMKNEHTSMSCSITAIIDTVTSTYHAAEPTCAGWTAAESIAIAMDTAPAYGSAQVRDPPPPLPPPPRKHRDWGPVNNAPPPIPWIVKDVCPGEYCSLGRWAACSTVTAYREKRIGAALALTVQRGEALTALKGDVHVDVPGMVVFRDTTSNPGTEGDQVDSIRFTPADTLYLLDEIGEGYLNWWFRGRVVPGYEFWDDTPTPSDPVVLIRRTESVWWVRVRNAAGREGWVPYDYRRFARDDRMDEISRCLRERAK